MALLKPTNQRNKQYLTGMLCNASETKHGNGRLTRKISMNVTIYTKNNCPNCVAAKQLLKAKNMEYREHNIETNQAAADWLAIKYPEARQMPQIFIGDQRVGGLAGLQQALKDLGK